MSNRQKTNGTAGAVGDRTGRKERYEHINLASIDRAWQLEQPGYKPNTQWRRK